jgi:hypothetical protein
MADLNYEADCTHSSGPNRFSGGDLTTDVDGNGRESVRIDIIVSHEIRGQIDPAFKNGIARGIVSRKVRLDYVPR